MTDSSSNANSRWEKYTGHRSSLSEALKTAKFDPQGLGQTVLKTLHLKGPDEPRPYDPDDVRAEWPTYGRSSVRASWLGHSSFVVQLRSDDGEVITTLFDPIFSDCIPLKAGKGPRRLFDVPFPAEDLPIVSLVVISHDHHDHLDAQTIRQITEHHPDATYMVPERTTYLLEQFGVPSEKIVEREWDHVATFISHDGSLQRVSDFSSMSASETSPQIKMTCLPALHHAGRTKEEEGRSECASWMMEYKDTDKDPVNVYFSGDTGYLHQSGVPTTNFENIAKWVAKPDLSLIGFSEGAGLPKIERQLGGAVRLSRDTCTRTAHANPEDAVDIHKDLKSRRSIGHHFGTYTTQANTDERVTELEQARADKNISGDWEDEGSFVIPQPGKWYHVPTAVGGDATVSS